MEYVYTALLLHKVGKELTEENVKSVLVAAGIKPNDSRVKVLIDSLEGFNIKETLGKLTPVETEVPAPALEEEIEEEKEEEVTDKDATSGLGKLFGD